MRFAKFDREATKAAGFHDRRSRIGVRADGTLRYDLAGKDKSELREKVFERDGWKCVDRPKTITDSMCLGPRELSHWPPMSKSGGSDSMETTFCRCQKHHRLLDNNQVKFR
jgi:hypothetical protein